MKKDVLRKIDARVMGEWEGGFSVHWPRERLESFLESQLLRLAREDECALVHCHGKDDIALILQHFSEQVIITFMRVFPFECHVDTDDFGAATMQVVNDKSPEFS